MKAAENKKWSHSGLTQHMEHCDGPYDGPQILDTRVHKNKNVLKYDLRVREALYIRRYDTGPYRGLNEDMGSYVKSNQWAPVFNEM